MGNEDREKVEKETVTLPEAATPALEGQPTAELEDVVVVEDLDRDTKSIVGEAQATASMENGDVFVILPEADTGDVPVIETHAVEDAEPLTEVGTETRGSSLQQIQEELEDEILTDTEAAPESSQELPTSVADEAPEEDLEINDGPGELESVGEKPHRSWLRVALPAAAALLLGVGGALYYFPGLREGNGGGPTAHAAPGTSPVALPAPVNDPVGKGSSTSPVDLAAEAKDAFRTKVQLAVRLGFGGEINR